MAPSASYSELKPSLMVQENWKGFLPLKFVLAEGESTTQQTAPFFVMASRQSYLPVVAAPAVAYFRENAVLFGEAQVWYEYQGVALKWQYPIGCLFDVYCNSEDLPLPITVHFQGMPPHILPCKDVDVVETSFFSSLKQALYLRFGTTEAVRDLPVSKQNELWEAITSGSIQKYWGVCRSMYSTPGSRNDSGNAKASYPIRILVKDEATGTINCIQRSIPVDTTLTLHGLFRQYFSDSVDLELPDIFSIPNESSPNAYSNSEINQRICIAGINPLLSSSIDNLCKSLSHADNFLYICIRN